jgi:hypothetical protein
MIGSDDLHGAPSQSRGLLFPKLRLGNPAQEALLPDRLCTFAPAPQKQTGSWSFRLEHSQAELGNQRSCWFRLCRLRMIGPDDLHGAPSQSRGSWAISSASAYETLIPKRVLGQKVVSLRDQRDEIMGAVEFLLAGL